MIDKDLYNQVEQKEETINFATIAGIFEDGVTLRFDGETEPTQKHYKVNSFAVFKVDDRVRIIKDSGTYVVEYSVGNPKLAFSVDKAKEAETANNALQLNGKSENSLSVANASKLNNKSESSLNVGTATDFSSKHTGSYLSFFNGSLAQKKTVTTLSSSASLSQTTSKLNELINALKSYNIISSY